MVGQTDFGTVSEDPTQQFIMMITREISRTDDFFGAFMEICVRFSSFRRRSELVRGKEDNITCKLVLKQC